MNSEDKQNELLSNIIENILPLLKQRDVDIVKACFGLDKKEPLEVDEAAQIFGLRTDQINRILRTTLKKVRNQQNELNK
jgi:DNA-directed RNA polymerase sigma subunit (sigma70/sigma32)